jgi:hypothetical protein
MIGEAPGYRGTAVSGVPFLSEGMIKYRELHGLALPVIDYAPSLRYADESGYEATTIALWSIPMQLLRHLLQKLERACL